MACFMEYYLSACKLLDVPYFGHCIRLNHRNDFDVDSDFTGGKKIGPVNNVYQLCYKVIVAFL